MVFVESFGHLPGSGTGRKCSEFQLVPGETEGSYSGNCVRLDLVRHHKAQTRGHNGK